MNKINKPIHPQPNKVQDVDFLAARLKIAINEAKVKLKKFEKQKEKFKEASKLFNQGMNYSQIARELNVSHTTIKEWVVKKEHLPKYLNLNLGGFING